MIILALRVLCSCRSGVRTFGGAVEMLKLRNYAKTRSVQVVARASNSFWVGVLDRP